MSKETIRMSDVLSGLIKQRAARQGITFSEYARKLLELGLIADGHRKTRQQVPNIEGEEYSFLTKRLLKTGIENLLLSRFIAAQHNSNIVHDVSEKAKEVLKSYFE